MVGGAAVGAPCLLLALVHFGVAGAARNCSTTSWGGVQLDFRRRPPHDARAAPLKACRAMSAYTCCGPSDDASILAAQRAYLAGEGTPTACSRIAATVLCAACHGEFGTGRIGGVLPSMCSDWFAACANLWFAATEGSQILRPCLNSDLVCAKLRDIVSDGGDFCQQAGVPVCSDEQRESGRRCFDGKPPRQIARISVAPRRGKSGKSEEGEMDLRWLWAVLGVGAGAVFAFSPALRRGARRA